MKKLIFFIIQVFVFISVSAQCVHWNHCNEDTLNMRKYNNYLLPHSTCGEVNLDILTPTNRLQDLYDSGVYYSGTFIYYGNYNVPNVCFDYAQPYNVKRDTIPIVGLSGYIKITSYDAMQSYLIDNFNYYFELRDESLNNILWQVSIKDTFINNCGYATLRYTEALFDTVIKVHGKFYVVYHTPDTTPQLTFPIDNMYNINTVIYATDNICPEDEDYPLLRNNSGDWIPLDVGNPVNPRPMTMLYLFPIYQETEQSELKEIEDNSDIIQVFPTPTTDMLNINSGYKIRNLELYDQQGKLLQEKQPDAYNCRISLSDFSKGVYFIKVITSKGQAIKKIIKE